MKYFAILFLLICSPVYADAESELNCLIQNMYHEARSEPAEGQLAVAFVTLNRVVSKRFPNTICGVVYQSNKNPDGTLVLNKCQFSWVCDGISDKMKNKKAYKQIRQYAIIAFKWYVIGEDFTRGATYYHATHIMPYWAKHFNKTVQIGNHIFYKGKA